MGEIGDSGLIEITAFHKKLDIFSEQYYHAQEQRLSKGIDRYFLHILKVYHILKSGVVSANI